MPVFRVNRLANVVGLGLQQGACFTGYCLRSKNGLVVGNRHVVPGGDSCGLAVIVADGQLHVNPGFLFFSRRADEVVAVLLTQLAFATWGHASRAEADALGQLRRVHHSHGVELLVGAIGVLAQGVFKRAPHHRVVYRAVEIGRVKRRFCSRLGQYLNVHDERDLFVLAVVGRVGAGRRHLVLVDAQRGITRDRAVQLDNALIARRRIVSSKQSIAFIG